MDDEFTFTILRLIFLLTMGTLVVGVVLRAGRDASEQRARLQAEQMALIRSAARAQATAAAGVRDCGQGAANVQ
jgi:hypothetical protein